VEPGLDDGPLGQTARVGAQLEHVRLERDHVEELRDAFLGLRRDRHDDRVAAPVLGREPVVAELLLDTLGVGIRLVDLVDRDQDRHLCGAGMVDGLDGLRHDAVGGGDVLPSSTWPIIVTTGARVDRPSAAVPASCSASSACSTSNATFSTWYSNSPATSAAVS